MFAGGFAPDGLGSPRVFQRATILLVAISDTSPEAQAKQFEISRSMTGEQRMPLAYKMSMFTRSCGRRIGHSYVLGIRFLDACPH